MSVKTKHIIGTVDHIGSSPGLEPPTRGHIAPEASSEQCLYVTVNIIFTPTDQLIYEKGISISSYAKKQKKKKSQNN